MNNISLARRFWVLVSCLSITLGLNPQAASGASREITLPSTFGGIIGHAGGGFVHNGVVGLVLGGSVGTPIRLASFSVSDAAIADDLVLDDFPPALPSKSTARGVVVNDQSGLAAIFGNGASEAQTVVAVSADVNGKLTKRWAISHPNPLGVPEGDEAAINADGSIVYFFYNDASPKVDKIRAEDGAILGTIQLDDFDIEAGLTFNPVLRRLIVKTGVFFHVLKPEPDFAVDWRLPSPVETLGVRRMNVSADGRFLIGYAGYQIDYKTGEKGNFFMTLDMESHQLRILSLQGKILPSDVALTFAPSLAALIVPYSSTVKVKDGTIKGCACGTQVADWLSLGPDGTLTREFTTQLAGDQQVIGPLNNAAFSRTSAIAFLATMTKHLVAIDTLTGEVVSDQEVGDVFFIYRIGDTDTFLTTNGTNVLTLLELDTGPSISSVTIKKHKVIVEGANFLSGVRVEISGVDLGVVNRNPDNPGREIILDKGKRDFPAGQPFNVVVINRDGLRSKPFTFQR